MVGKEKTGACSLHKEKLILLCLKTFCYASTSIPQLHGHKNQQRSTRIWKKIEKPQITAG
jgi:hypothetical protein